MGLARGFCGRRSAAACLLRSSRVMGPSVTRYGRRGTVEALGRRVLPSRGLGDGGRVRRGGQAAAGCVDGSQLRDEVRVLEPGTRQRGAELESDGEVSLSGGSRGRRRRLLRGL